MTDLRKLQQTFAQAVFTGTDGFQGEIEKQGALSRRDRVGIYRNAYRQRLAECIESDHEVLATYLGDRLFDQLVNAYVDNHVSASPSLRNYCDFLPEFLAGRSPFSDYPVVAEIARFERCLLSVFDAADSIQRKSQDLSEIAADEWPELVFDFHPSYRLYKSEWNVVPIWQAAKAGLTPPAPDQQSPSAWAMFRNHERLTAFRSVDIVEQAIVQVWMGGGTFAGGCEAALGSLAEEDVATRVLDTLTANLADGAISNWRIATRPAGGNTEDA